MREDIRPKITSVKVEGTTVKGEVLIAQYREFTNKVVTNPIPPRKLKIVVKCIPWGAGKTLTLERELVFNGTPKKIPFEFECSPGKYTIHAGIVKGYGSISDLKVITISAPKPKPAPKPAPSPKPAVDVESLEDWKSYRVTYKGGMATAEYLGRTIKSLVREGRIYDITAIVEVPPRPVYAKTEKKDGKIVVQMTHEAKQGFQRVKQPVVVNVKLNQNTGVKTVPKPQPKPPTPKPAVLPQITPTPKPPEVRNIDWENLRLIAAILIGLYLIGRLRK